MTDKVGSTESQTITFLRKRDYVMVRELGAGACGRTVLLHQVHHAMGAIPFCHRMLAD